MQQKKLYLMTMLLEWSRSFYMRLLIFIFLGCAIWACDEPIEEIKVFEEGTLVESYFITRDSTKTGRRTTYHPNGEIAMIENYENGQLEGERLFYFLNGSKEIQENYKVGTLHGAYRDYYQTGELKSEGTFVDGAMTSVFKGFYKNGKVKEEVTFAENEENGPFIEYYENGKMHWKGTYLNGNNEFGLLEEFDSTGMLVKKMNCDSMAICRTIWTRASGDVKLKDEN